MSLELPPNEWVPHGFTARLHDSTCGIWNGCQQCHALDTATKKGSRDWNTVISSMATYGAMITPVEQKILIEYLERLARLP